MTLLESDLSPEISSLGNDVLIGYKMTIARDVLATFLSKPTNYQFDEDDAFSAVMTDYLNCLQENWYEQDLNTRCNVINELPRRIKAEAELLFKSIEPIEDIKDRIEEYLSDDVSNDYKKQNLSPYPRATTLVMLDIIDEYR